MSPIAEEDAMQQTAHDSRRRALPGRPVRDRTAGAAAHCRRAMMAR